VVSSLTEQTDPRDLAGTGLSEAWVAELVERTLAEDLVGGAPLPGPPDLAVAHDVTSAATVPAGQLGTADLVARADGVVAGLPVAARVFARLAPGATLTAGAADGDRVARGDVLLTVRGPVRALLAAERSALNIASRASGIATHTRAWVDAIEGTKAQVLDTRKTTPGLRPLEKYAVRCGGGRNHRAGLYDGVLVKENHLRMAGGVSAALAVLDGRVDGLPVEIEAETLAQVREALDGGAPRILLDNMSPEEVREAVGLTAGRAELEASGGVSLGTVRAYAETGVDFVSVGALTHSARSLHVSLEVR
jgi:nicotinate-nucleotide pyrophosphorylase (carboxylating)